MRNFAHRIRLGFFLALGFFAPFLSWAQEAPEGGAPSPPPAASSPKEETPRQEAVKVGPKELLQVISSAKWSLDLYLPLLSYKDLASAVAALAKENGVKVRIITEDRALSLSSTYLYSLALLGLKYPIQVKVVAATPGIDPRAIVDRTYLIVGGGLEGIDPLISPTLFFKDPAYAEKELQRFERTWLSAPSCRPRARYNQATGRVLLSCELVR